MGSRPRLTGAAVWVFVVYWALLLLIPYPQSLVFRHPLLIFKSCCDSPFHRTFQISPDNKTLLFWKPHGFLLFEGLAHSLWNRLKAPVETLNDWTIKTTRQPSWYFGLCSSFLPDSHQSSRLWQNGAEEKWAGGVKSIKQGLHFCTNFQLEFQGEETVFISRIPPSTSYL